MSVLFILCLYKMFWIVRNIIIFKCSKLLLTKTSMVMVFSSAVIAGLKNFAFESSMAKFEADITTLFYNLFSRISCLILCTTVIPVISIAKSTWCNGEVMVSSADESPILPVHVC